MRTIWCWHSQFYKNLDGEGKEFTVTAALWLNLTSFLFGIKYVAPIALMADDVTQEGLLINFAFFELKIIWGTHPEIVEVQQ